VSALAQTGVVALEDAYGYKMKVEKGNMYVEYNGAALQCMAPNSENVRFLAVLETIRVGMQLIANHYPQYVTIMEEDYE
jgi:uncharacterized protein YsxB (DUF464 family)